MSEPTPDDRRAAAVLASLPAMTSQRLRTLLHRRSPTSALAVLGGREPLDAMSGRLFRRAPELRDRWRQHLRSQGPIAADRCDELGVTILLPGTTGWPPQLVLDPDPPAVLFVQGDPAAIDARRVGVVGTRHPTQRGRQIAARVGHELAEAGVAVVSGLALGIDGAAHRGALASRGAAPVAVIAHGHHRAYPRSHAALFREVAEHGLLLSEWPPGVEPERYRFPRRNRILASLSEIVLVVESRETGGSLITVAAALERGIDVFAVPGPIDRRASNGPNQLIASGAGVMNEPGDLLVALGLDGARSGRRAVDARPRPTGDAARVLDVVGDGGAELAQVAGVLDLDLADAAMAVARLERDGWIVEADGWFERLDEWAGVVH
ncbi:MAG: DNA-processing protein DprA [Actinomycetota bacterium]